jgi:carbon monoxide dehydrogenase subunit G
VQFFDSFSVKAPVDAVFAGVSDLERLVPCVPGAAVVRRSGEDVCEVALRIHMGPVWKDYVGTITVVRRDPAAHHVAMTVSARDARGAEAGDATVAIDLAELGPHTSVSISSQVAIGGGGLAESAIRQTSERQLAEFTASLRTMVGGGSQP